MIFGAGYQRGCLAAAPRARPLPLRWPGSLLEPDNLKTAVKRRPREGEAGRGAAVPALPEVRQKSKIIKKSKRKKYAARCYYRGLAKNRNLLSVAFALADLCILSWAGRSWGGYARHRFRTIEDCRRIALHMICERIHLCAQGRWRELGVEGGAWT